MPDIDIQLATSLSPEEVIRYFERKGYKINWSWRETWQEAHAKAFTVAKAMRLDILSDIRNELDRSIKEGRTFQEFKENLTPVLKSKGWWGKVKAKDVPGVDISKLKNPEEEVLLGSPSRLKTIYRTNLDTAYSAGHYHGMIENAENRPYWMYNAVMDSRTRPSHAALNGKVFRYDDPIWDKIYPPNDWNCRCTVIPLDNDDVEEMNLKVSKGSPEMVELMNVPPEWQYNPGKSFFEFDPDFGRFSQNPNQPNYQSYNQPSIESIPEEYYSEMPELFPSIKSAGKGAFEKYLQEEFNLLDKSFSIIETADKDQAIFTMERLNHLLEKSDGRERFIPLIKKTLQEPYEIWMSEYISDKGFLEYRKLYIGLFKDNKKRTFFTALRMEKDSTIFWNAFPKDIKYMDKLRRGVLLYKK